MKKVFILLLLASICMKPMQGQMYQSTNGTGIQEDAWAVVEDAALGAFVSVGNSSLAGMSQLWISSYAANGTVLTSATATNNRNLIARDICIAPVHPLNGPTYYVTGWTQINFQGAMINQIWVGRIDLGGNFIWFQENPVAGQGNDKEGVAVATAPNGDCVATGHVMWPGGPGVPIMPQVILTRFTAIGAIVWSNVYNQPGFWMVREINNGMAPAGTPGIVNPNDVFVITGEVVIPPMFGGIGAPQTFVAAYTGVGVEMWRTIVNQAAQVSTGDAGYDVVYDPNLNVYHLAGVAQLGLGRAVPASTPYTCTVTIAGLALGGTVHLAPTMAPLGFYPRAIALAPNNQLVVSGPDYANNSVFFGQYPALAGPPPPMMCVNYPGLASANSVPQPFWLNDAQPEGIINTTIGTIPGFLISTNSLPTGAFGMGDAHFISTNVTGQTPTTCPAVPIPSIAVNGQQQVFVPSAPINLLAWAMAPMVNAPYPIQQQQCLDPCIVSASFTATVSGQTVTFNNTSTGNGTLSYAWAFGDGNTSALPNPVHTYAGAGPYTACLTVTNTNASGITCTATFCQTFTFCNVNADFTFTLNCKTATFTNATTGTGPFTYSWLYPDGTTSTATNPVKVFAACGNYNVRLIACNATCCDTIIKTVSIACCNAAVDFCLQATGRAVTLNNNTTVNPTTGTTYTVFVDGVLTSWTNNTAKTLLAGAHTICVKARRIICGDTCCATCCKAITVSDQCALNTSFWHQVQGGLGVLFTNKSTGTNTTSTTYLWEFGDGTTSTLLAPAVKTYATPGTYTACLTVTKVNAPADTCREKMCRQIIVEAPCAVLAKYKTKICIAAPLTVEFTNQSVGGVTYDWNFGDGNTSTATNPTHTYAAAGTYIVCLKATVNGGCWSLACHQVRVSTVTCNNSCSTLPGAPSFLNGDSESNGEGYVEPEMNDWTYSNSADDVQEKKSGEEEMKTSLNLFPNPANDEINVMLETQGEDNAQITILSASGEIVHQSQRMFYAGTQQVEISTQHFADGLYHLTITLNDEVLTKHFVVTKQ
ncbi:MAG: PKD domain-containing protein [Flavobacteriales bacterium]